MIFTEGLFSVRIPNIKKVNTLIFTLYIHTITIICCSGLSNLRSSLVCAKSLSLSSSSSITPIHQQLQGAFTAATAASFSIDGAASIKTWSAVVNIPAAARLQSRPLARRKRSPSPGRQVFYDFFLQNFFFCFCTQTNFI